jgi:cephalosporin hydroxylase
MSGLPQRRIAPIAEFQNEVRDRIKSNSQNLQLLNATRVFNDATHYWKYSYNFEWLGRPIIQYPQDMVAMQELIWHVQPDLVIETGIAHGGSLILSASILALLEYCDAQQKGEMLNPSQPKRKVLGIDIDIRSHNRKAIEAHPMHSRIEMIEGSSNDSEIVNQVKEFAKSHERIMVCLDSNHTHEHVLAELEAYATLVSKGSYCVVFDTIIDDMPEDMFPDRPWGPGNNPKTAVREYLSTHPDFEIDEGIQHKFLVTVAPDGYLVRVR